MHDFWLCAVSEEGKALSCEGMKDLESKGSEFFQQYINNNNKKPVPHL